MAHAAIDIGSNTLRLLIAEPATGAPWHTLFYTHRICRLGEGLHHSGRLGEAGMARTLAALGDFARFCADHGVGPAQIHAVATAAMREAENGRDFCRSIRAETGIEVRVIDGNHEAQTALAGSLAVLDAATRQDMLLFDIGGGSTEFTRASDGKMIDGISRKLGVVRLVEAHLRSDPPTAAEFEAMVAASDAHLIEVERHWPDGRRPQFLVGTAGTVTTLAATAQNLLPYSAAAINNYAMTRSEFAALRDRLLAMRHAEREKLPTIEAGRADLILAGLAIIEAIFRRWDYAALITVDAGLLEGVWLDHI